MQKLILGLVGEIASGKDTFADYVVEKYNGQKLSFSSPIRTILDILGLPATRDNLIDLATDMRNRFGADIWGKAIVREIEKSQAKIIILPNVRLDDDIVLLKDNPGFKLIHIDTDQKLRFERLTNRTQNPDDKTKTWEEFLEDSEKPTELPIREVAKQATIVINNNGNAEELYKKIDEIMKSFGPLIP